MFSFALVSAALVALASANPAVLSGRIYGGRSVPIESYPYQVSLESNGRHSCGGSIIAPHYVLTAAHCVENFESQYLGARAGSSYVHKGGQVHDVDRVVIHEDYKYNEQGIPIFDVALAHVQQPFEYGESVKPVGLFEKSVAPGSRAVVTGWGLTEKGSSLPSQLQAVEIPVHSREFCDEAWASFEGVPQGQICAGEGGRGVCTADSGSPLVLDGRQIGVVSWSSPVCAHPKFPGVYMEVASLIDWIRLHAEL